MGFKFWSNNGRRKEMIYIYIYLYNVFVVEGKSICS